MKRNNNPYTAVLDAMNNIRDLTINFVNSIAIKVLHTSSLNIIMVTLKVLPLGSYALMPTPSPPFKTILELVLWNGLQICHYITPAVVNVI
jgi:hypothetical protein